MYKVELKQWYSNPGVEFEFECFADMAVFVKSALIHGNCIIANITMEGTIKEKDHD